MPVVSSGWSTVVLFFGLTLIFTSIKLSAWCRTQGETLRPKAEDATQDPRPKTKDRRSMPETNTKDQSQLTTDNGQQMAEATFKIFRGDRLTGRAG